jgi:hypothetical protein
MKVRVTLVNNLNQQQRAIIVTNESLQVKQLVSIAKNKLKTKVTILYSTKTKLAVELSD